MPDGPKVAIVYDRRTGVITAIYNPEPSTGPVLHPNEDVVRVSPEFYKAHSIDDLCRLIPQLERGQ